MYAANEILFPAYVISQLCEARGEAWQNLVRRITDLPEHHEDKLAFMLMMIRLNGCMECETDSYRAMRGCHLCALQTLRRFKGTDEQLLEHYEAARDEVQDYVARHGQQRFATLQEVL
jgi:hypothetical protein